MNIIKKHLLPISIYPLIMSSALLMQALMNSTGASIQASSYVPVITALVFIILLERYIPYRRHWNPKPQEAKTDTLFIIIVQILLPKFLVFILSISLIENLQAYEQYALGIWPGHWPLLYQVILMLVSADFLRYWLHRAAHSNSALWRLHAVHHSPDKLYCLNTGRFHPIEKSIQFLVDSLPFILLGVGPDILACYFVFYAVNGFFQHCNINLKMGILNYIISSAELHRWHHSKDIDESGKNYGNNLIIWDTIFFTRYLPSKSHVKDLGLINDDYPESFLEQMKTPFTPKIDKQPIKPLGYKDIFYNLFIQASMFLSSIIQTVPFKFALSNPMKHQWSVLFKTIKANKKTEYGKKYSFKDINSYEDFCRLIPIQDYEDIRPYIERQEKEQRPIFTQEQPKYYAATSGTTGRPKYIPILSQNIKQHKKALSIFSCIQNSSQKHAFSGRLLAIPGPYIEGTLAGATTYGSISGLLYYLMPSFLQRKYIIPHEVFSIKDYALKYSVILRLAAQHEDISYMVSANPSTFLKLNDLLNGTIDTLANDLELGSFSAINKLSSTIKNRIKPFLLQNKKQACKLRQLKTNNERISIADIWPNLRLIATWTGGSCGASIENLCHFIPKTTQIIDLGYLSSEFRGSITFKHSGNSGYPTLTDNFFEFIEVDEYEEGFRTPITLDKLEAGKYYYVIITTPSLFRYFMNDIVEVTAYDKKTPLIRFHQKGKGITNITGEKLSEQQLITAITEINNDLNIAPSFYIALASINDFRYELYLESIINCNEYAKKLDDKLSILNLEYKCKRDSGRLNPITVKALKPGSGDAYKQHMISQGIRESQFKPLLIQYRHECAFSFENHLL